MLIPENAQIKQTSIILSFPKREELCITPLEASNKPNITVSTSELLTPSFATISQTAPESTEKKIMYEHILKVLTVEFSRDLPIILKKLLFSVLSDNFIFVLLLSLLHSMKKDVRTERKFEISKSKPSSLLSRTLLHTVMINGTEHPDRSISAFSVFCFETPPEEYIFISPGLAGHAPANSPKRHWGMSFLSIPKSFDKKISIFPEDSVFLHISESIVENTVNMNSDGTME